MTTSPYGPSRGFRHLDRRGTLLLAGPARRSRDRARGGALRPALDPILESVVFHIYVVSAIAACALFVALATASFAVRDGRAAPAPARSGCVAVGFMMLGHGLTTPGIFGRPMNMWVARLPGLGARDVRRRVWPPPRVRTGAISRLVARSPRRRPRCSRRCRSRSRPRPSRSSRRCSGLAPCRGRTRSRRCCSSRAPSRCWWSVGSTGGAGSWGGTASSWRWSWRAGSTMSALLSLAYGTFWRLSWWDYHIYLLAGFAAAAWAVVAGYRGSRTLEGAVGGITVRDPLEQVAHGQPDALHALIGAVEAKDPYTHGHSVRVAELSTTDRAAPGAGTGCGAWPASGRVPARRREDQRPGPGPEQAGRAGRG